MDISGVIFEPDRSPDHEDERRTLFTAFNGDLDGFKSAQNKMIVAKQDAKLGGHYHEDYYELHFVLHGEALFHLQSVDNPNLMTTCKMKPGSRLLIPPRVAHKATVTAGTILVSNTTKKYVSAKANDVPFEVKEAEGK